MLNGTLYTMGGEKKSRTVDCNDKDITPLRDMFAFTPASNAWKNATWLPDARMRFAAASAGGRIFVFGGQGAPITEGDYTEIPLLFTVFAYDPAGVPSASPSPSPASSASSALTYSPGVLGGAIVATGIGMLIAVVLAIFACRRYCPCCLGGAAGVGRDRGATAQPVADAGGDHKPLRQADESAPRMSLSEVIVEQKK